MSINYNVLFYQHLTKNVVNSVFKIRLQKLFVTFIKLILFYFINFSLILLNLIKCFVICTALLLQSAIAWNKFKD